MFSYSHKLRVRYSETDQMGYAYYGNYPAYYEAARVEALRSIGLPYQELERDGILLPVLENWSKYLKPALYDEELTVKVMVKSLPGVRFVFDYEIFNEAGDLLHMGKTTLVFVNQETRRPMNPPSHLIDKLKPYFE